MAGNNPNIQLFLQNNIRYVEQLRNSRFRRHVFWLNPFIKTGYIDYTAAVSPEEKNTACTKILNAYEERFIWRAGHWIRCFVDDVNIFFHQAGRRRTIDYSKGRFRDYYSVAVIVKNEARYLREFILFYKATGADRIYIYDNDSTDNLLETIEPFLKSGLVVYRKWSGRSVQTAAYRDVIRRTKHRTKWLALIDADEFLFSPLGRMPDQLKAYERFPGIGVNWLMYGPNGHVQRPEGLVMDNYTTTLAEYGAGINCHIKSIVQPEEVFCVFHTHYVIYKKRKYAVNENCDPIDNYNSYIPRTGKSFTQTNNRRIFRINHYGTKSLEDLKEKCLRGYADGSPNASFKEQLRTFEAPLIQDYTIKPYADIVRHKLEEKEVRHRKVERIC